MRALVTGASGFIGGHVVAALVSRGADVRAFDRHAPPEPVDGAVEVVLGDILDPDAIARAVDGCDAIFHLAAVYSYRRGDAAAMQAINVEGTRTLLAAAIRGPRRRIVHTSSCATCGPVPGRPATERDLPAPRDLAVPYKRTKLEGERLALAAAREGTEVVVVNPTVPIGPGDLRPTPTGKMVADVAAGRARGYLAHSSLNVVAVEDVAAGHMLAFERGRSGERYLLGGEDISIRAVFAAIARGAGLAAPRIPRAVDARVRGRARGRCAAAAARPGARAAAARRGPRRPAPPSLRRRQGAGGAGLRLPAGGGGAPGGRAGGVAAARRATRVASDIRLGNPD